MNLEKRFVAIKDFLNKHQYLHELEALERFPLAQNQYTPWIENLTKCSDAELISIENNLHSDEIEDTNYKNFLAEIVELIKLPKKLYSVEEIPQNLKRKLSNKKQHEVQIIKSQLSNLSPSNIIDIGSGAGHLSSILLNNNSRKSQCIDLDPNFQEIGKKKLTREAPEILNRMTFKLAEVNDQYKIPFQNNAILIGLHACGNLSVSLTRIFCSTKISYFLNYGCCYHKLDIKHINISELSKDSPNIFFTNHALTMAAKSYKKLQLGEFYERQSVKNYRYTLHILMKEELNIPFKTLGNAKKDDYKNDFSFYAKKFLPETKALSVDYLESYYHSKKDDVKRLICYGVLRSHLSRLIEIYLILDRGIFLKENGYKVTVTETFDRSISPRNISLLAQR